MNQIVSILEGFEKLTYRILIWFILIPKTVIKIILNPSFARSYIRNELKRDQEPRFDEYMSPMLLYLGITLLPALAVYLLQQYGTSLSYPADNLIYGRDLYFEAKTVYKSRVYGMGHEYEWQVWGCGGLDEYGACMYDQSLTAEKHNVTDGVYSWDYELGGYGSTGEVANLQFIDQITTQDSYDVRLDGPGYYRGYIYSKNFSYDTPEKAIEEYFDWFIIYVPENPDEPVQIYGETNQKDGQEQINYVENLQTTETILMGLAMLFPPLFFALMSNLSRKIQLSEGALRESFYSQCYYFTPVGLAIWASYYATGFYTIDFAIPQVALQLPLYVAVLWFVSAETKDISLEKNTKIGKAFLILFTRLILLLLLVILFAALVSEVDFRRTILVYAYPIVTIGLIVIGFVLKIKKRSS